jgi:hypothetical protein
MLPFSGLFRHGAFLLYWRRRVLFFVVIVILRGGSSRFTVGLLIVPGTVVVLMIHRCLVVVERFFVWKVLFGLDPSSLGEAELDFFLADVTEAILVA